MIVRWREPGRPDRPIGSRRRHFSPIRRPIAGAFWWVSSITVSYTVVSPTVAFHRFFGDDRVQINVSARHGQLSNATQSKIVSKVSRLKRYFSRLTALNVMVDLENPSLPAVEVIASAEEFHEMVSREHAAQLWRSVDGAVQKLEQQLRKHKEKVLDQKRVAARRS
jgi:putative sigma-54 modulation protein